MVDRIRNLPLFLAALLVATVTMLSPVNLAQAQGTITQPRLQIYAGPLHREYLGCLNCDRFDVASIWDGYGPMGWDNGYIGISHFHTYFSPHGHYSACDPYADDPPILIDRSLKNYGLLNISTTRPSSICGPQGSSDICEKLRARCERSDSAGPP